MAIPDKDSFRQCLLNVSEGLSDDDLHHLKHVCRDVLTRREIDSVSTGYGLFELLEEKGKLGPNNKWYLADLLLVINQNCLLDHLGLGNVLELELESRRCQLGIYRLWLTKLAMEIDDEDFRALKSACQCHREEVTNFYDLIIFLENKKKINPKSKIGVDFLVEAFRKAGLTKEGSKISSELKSFEELIEKDEVCYRMTSKPKGICVIINNVEFSRKEKWRYGSNVDAERLERLFQHLSFNVRRYDNLTSDKMISTLREISSLDHWLYDSFICCVLSHGSLGRVFGVDDVAVQIQQLLNLFSITNCPSLEGKPKVFFFQACQGEKYEKGPSPSGSSASSECLSDAKIDDSAPSVTDLEPHLLLGYATPPGFRSYRHSQQGSWYIQELIGSLKKLAEDEDILSILTQVNDKVTQREGIDNTVSVKQTPMPIFTLTKKLYLAQPGELSQSKPSSGSSNMATTN